MRQKQSKKIYWKQLEYIDLGQQGNVSKSSAQKPVI